MEDVDGVKAKVRLSLVAAVFAGLMAAGLWAPVADAAEPRIADIEMAAQAGKKAGETDLLLDKDDLLGDEKDKKAAPEKEPEKEDVD